MHTEFTPNGELAALPHFITSLAIGLLIGLERERSPGSRAGLRTFALVALFGTLAAMLSEQTTPWLLLSGLLIVGAMTPPLAVTLFISTRLCGVEMQDSFPDVLHFIAIYVVLLLVLTFVPGITMWLPSQM